MRDEPRPEFDLAYRQAKPNRFASGLKKGVRVNVLEREVAEFFQSSQDVNAVPLALLRTMPPSRAEPERVGGTLELDPDHPG